jgi:hypothetical protein
LQALVPMQFVVAKEELTAKGMSTILMEQDTVMTDRSSAQDN